VVLVNEELTDDVRVVEYDPDESYCPSILDMLADNAGIHNGPRTRRDLYTLQAEMIGSIVQPNGADYDRVIAEFIRRGKEAEYDEEMDERERYRD
jgi:hypothetical protein